MEGREEYGVKEASAEIVYLQNDLKDRKKLLQEKAWKEDQEHHGRVPL